MILWHKHSRRWLSRRIRYIDLVHDVILHHMWLSLCDVMWYQCYKEIDSLLCPILLFISVAFHRKMIRFITSDLHYSDKEWLRKTLLSILISYILHFSPLHTHFTCTPYLTSTTSHVPSFLPSPPLPPPSRISPYTLLPHVPPLLSTLTWSSTDQLPLPVCPAHWTGQSRRLSVTRDNTLLCHWRNNHVEEWRDPRHWVCPCGVRISCVCEV